VTVTEGDGFKVDSKGHKLINSMIGNARSNPGLTGNKECNSDTDSGQVVVVQTDTRGNVIRASTNVVLSPLGLPYVRDQGANWQRGQDGKSVYWDSPPIGDDPVGLKVRVVYTDVLSAPGERSDMPAVIGSWDRGPMDSTWTSNSKEVGKEPKVALPPVQDVRTQVKAVKEMIEGVTGRLYTLLPRLATELHPLNTGFDIRPMSNR
jgi:hypothetical protein